MKNLTDKIFGHSGIIFVAAMTVVAFVAPTAVAGVADMDDLTLAPGTYWNGASDWAAGGYQPNDPPINNTFTSGPATFSNIHQVTDYGYGATPYFEGWSYSNVNDTTTAGFSNQYAAITGTGEGGSGNYGVFYSGFLSDPSAATVTFGQSTVLDGMHVTNVTYPYLSMRDGDGFAKQFGGATGDDPDYLLLTIEGLDESNNSVGTVDFYMADFRDSDNANDYIVDTWEWVDLDSLGEVDGLRFSFVTTDVGDFGANTPLYFAMDNLTTIGGSGSVGVPEPSSILIGLAGFALLVFQWRRRK